MRFWRNWRPHVTDYLSAFSDGVLPPPEFERVSQHLNLCESCRQELDEAGFGVVLAKCLVPVPAPDGLWDSIEQRWTERAAGLSSAGHWGGFTHRVPRWVAGAAASALLVATIAYLGAYPGVRRRPPQPAVAAGGVTSQFELGPYLQPVEAAPAKATFRAIASAAPSFASVDRHVALEVAGLGASNTTGEPLPGYSLVASRVAHIGGNRLAQLVFGNGADAFSVFVALRRLKFLFGDETCVAADVNGIHCQKIDCDLQQSYVFGEGPLQCVLLSKSLGADKAAAVMRYFTSALKRSRRDN